MQIDFWTAVVSAIVGGVAGGVLPFVISMLRLRPENEAAWQKIALKSAERITELEKKVDLLESQIGGTFELTARHVIRVGSELEVLKSEATLRFLEPADEQKRPG